MSWLGGRWRQLDEWWFGGRSPATLCLLRILMGAMAFLALGLTLFIFSDFYSPEGYAPGPMIRSFLHYDSNYLWRNMPWEFRMPFEVPRLSILGSDPSYGWTLTVYLSTMLAAALFSLGLFTRVSGIALAAGMISIHTRNPLIIHAGDTLLRLSVIYLALSPCGRMYSLDALRRRQKVPDESSGERVEPPKVRVTSQRLIQYQLALVYLTTAWGKGFGTFWLDGTATWYPARMHEFMRFPMPAIFERQPFLAMETYGTLIVEIALGTLVFWKPARKWVLLAGVLMHAYIEYAFNIPMFAAVIVACYVAFYEGEEVEAWVARNWTRVVRRRSAYGNLSADAGE